MSRINLKKLEYSPVVNPLWESRAITIKAKKRGQNADVISLETGEITGCAVIRRIEQVDDEHFVKVFAAGVAASFDLSKTAQRVFSAVLEEYQRAPMSGGYAESVTLFWFNGGLDGRALDMSERTFRRGLVELLEKGFLAPRRGHEFWVNPHLFFRGDRVMFAREYRKSTHTPSQPTKSNCLKKNNIERDPDTVDFIDGLTDHERERLANPISG